MEYKFTAILIILLTSLAFCMKPEPPTSLKMDSKKYIIPPPKPKINEQ